MRGQASLYDPRREIVNIGALRGVVTNSTGSGLGLYVLVFRSGIPANDSF